MVKACGKVYLQLLFNTLKVNAMSHLEKRRQLYYAVLTIPIKAREALGKVRFVKSTGTGDRRMAVSIASQYVAGWRVLIEQVGGAYEESSNLVKAIQFREEIEKAVSDDKREGLMSALHTKAEEIEEFKGLAQAKEFYSVAIGASEPVSISYARWKAQLTLVPKTIEQMVKDVDLFLSRFTTLESVTALSAIEWMDELETQGKSLLSRKRIVSNTRNYWRYLQARKIVPKEYKPLAELVVVPKNKKTKLNKANAAYKPQQVVDLYKASLAQSKSTKYSCDQQLADLILLCSYTGARIEEMCSLKIADIDGDTYKITDAKTNAGIREVPFHSYLKPTIDRLKADSKDGYLLTGLTFNKYQDRSNAIGKRFGRLKTKLGYPSRISTAHSFRSTLVSQLRHKGVAESLVADLVGHDNPTITFGLYSEGASMEAMREALEKVSYPF